LLHFPDAAVRAEVIGKQLVPLVYADDSGTATEQYPFNPNGSPWLRMFQNAREVDCK
jgi:phosphoribosylformylglycinamidine synthase